MTLRERMLNNAVLRLQRQLLQRVGHECAAVTNTVRAFQAEAGAARRNPFELIPIYLARFDAEYGEALQPMSLGRHGRRTPEANYQMPSRKSPTATSRRSRLQCRLPNKCGKRMGEPTCSPAGSTHGCSPTRLPDYFAKEHQKALENDRKTLGSARSYSYLIRGYTRRPNARDLVLLDRLSLLGASGFGPEEVAVLLASDRETARASLERLVAGHQLKRTGNGRYCLPPLMRLLAQERIALAESLACSGRFSKRYIH